MKPTIQPVNRVTDRRARERREQERRAAAGQSLPGKAGLPVPVGVAKTVSHPASNAAGEDAAFAAQLLGQGGAKRGLRGGPPVLEEARSAYLEAEWSGVGDRRKRLGRITKTEI